MQEHKTADFDFLLFNHFNKMSILCLIGCACNTHLFIRISYPKNGLIYLNGKISYSLMNFISNALQNHKIKQQQQQQRNLKENTQWITWNSIRFNLEFARTVIYGLNFFNQKSSKSNWMESVDCQVWLMNYYYTFQTFVVKLHGELKKNIRL